MRIIERATETRSTVFLIVPGLSVKLNHQLIIQYTKYLRARQKQLVGISACQPKPSLPSPAPARLFALPISHACCTFPSTESTRPKEILLKSDLAPRRFSQKYLADPLSGEEPLLVYQRRDIRLCSRPKLAPAEGPNRPEPDPLQKKTIITPLAHSIHTSPRC